MRVKDRPNALFAAVGDVIELWFKTESTLLLDPNTGQDYVVADLATEYYHAANPVVPADIGGYKVIAATLQGNAPLGLITFSLFYYNRRSEKSNTVTHATTDPAIFTAPAVTHGKL